MIITQEQENQINDLWVKRFYRVLNIDPVIFEEIIKEGIALATKPKRWIRSTEQKPEEYKDIHFNFKGDEVVLYGYFHKHENGIEYFVDVKNGGMWTASLYPELYWQYVDLPKPITKENV